MRPNQLLLILLVFTSVASAKNLGTYGEVFKIKEESLLEVIEGRLAKLKEEGKMEKIQKEMQEKAAAKVARPTPIEGLKKATAYRKREFDPTFVVSQDIKDHLGNLIAKKGASYNPLNHKSFGIPLLFIDGDDEAQVRWALSQKGKIILVNGAPLELEKTHKKAFYFDQGGVLTEKLGLKEVPCRVSQQEKHLLIEAMPVLKGKSE